MTVTDCDLVHAAARTYSGVPAAWVGMRGAVRVYRSLSSDGVPIFAFEGTHDPIGWALDFFAIPVPAQGALQQAVGWVHAGFALALDSVWDDVSAVIEREPVYALAGHSLGAALAVLATARMAVQEHPPVRWGAFAPPRVGMEKLVKLVEAVPGRAWAYGNDPVVGVPFAAPPLWPYYQVALTKCGKPMPRKWDAHAIGNYVAAVIAATEG